MAQRASVSCGPLGPCHRRRAEAQPGGLPVGGGPADEVAGLVPVADLGAGRPLVQVRLGAGGQGQVAAGQPVQEVDRGGGVAAHIECLEVAGVGGAEAAAQPAQMVPDRVAVQQLPLGGIGTRGDGVGDPPFERDEPFVAGRERTAGDQDGPQVVEGLAGGQFVEHVVGQRPMVCGDLGEQPGHGRPGQPRHRGDRPGHPGQRVSQRGEVGADVPVAAGQEVVHPLGQSAAVAGAVWAELPGLAADGAAVPERRVGVNAAGAQRLGAGAAPNRGNGAAATAAGPPRLAAVTPRLTTGPGDFAWPGPPAHPAGQSRARAAALAPRPVRRARRDPAAASAADTVLQVDRVVGQAVRAQRPTGGVPGRWLAHRAAAGAGHRGGAGETGAADPLPVVQLGQRDHAIAARARRPGNAPGPRRGRAGRRPAYDARRKPRGSVPNAGPRGRRDC